MLPSEAEKVAKWLAECEHLGFPAKARDWNGTWSAEAHGETRFGPARLHTDGHESEMSAVKEVNRQARYHAAAKILRGGDVVVTRAEAKDIWDHAGDPEYVKAKLKELFWT